MSREFLLPDAAATDALGAALAGAAPVRAVVYLQGPLGAGKSSLARAWLRALGVTGAIKSPTYTLVERYPLPGGQAAHLDLYRLAAASELDFLGLDELAAEAGLWLVEWPERGAGGLPAPDLSLTLALDGPGRRLRAEAGSAAGAEWLAKVPY
jgi:tRNA threonylcarbamoyladenosine biosynthesis protein TsaE